MKRKFFVYDPDGNIITKKSDHNYTQAVVFKYGFNEDTYGSTFHSSKELAEKINHFSEVPKVPIPDYAALLHQDRPHLMTGEEYSC